MRQAEMEVRKGQNLIEHEEEIYSRPARTWFQSSREKQKAEGLHCYLDTVTRLLTYKLRPQ